MSTDHQVIADIDFAFGQVGRPSRFLPDVGDPEFNDHEELLQSHTRTTIRRTDVGGGYDPICSCEPQGVAYYFPSLARFALEEPGDPMEWYAAQLFFISPTRGQKIDSWVTVMQINGTPLLNCLSISFCRG